MRSKYGNKNLFWNMCCKQNKRCLNIDNYLQESTSELNRFIKQISNINDANRYIVCKQTLNWIENMRKNTLDYNGYFCKFALCYHPFFVKSSGNTNTFVGLLTKTLITCRNKSFSQHFHIARMYKRFIYVELQLASDLSFVCQLTKFGGTKDMPQATYDKCTIFTH